MNRWTGRIANGLLGLGLAGLLAFQGTPAPFNRLKSGLEYRIFKRENGRYVRRPALPPTGDATYASRLGQVMGLHMEIRTAKDSVLMNSRRQMPGQLMRVPLDTLRRYHRGSFEEAVSLLQPGDSGVFRFNADSLFRKSFRRPVPPHVRRAGNTITVLVKAVKVQTPQAVQQEAQRERQLAQERERQQAAQLAQQEDARIQAYMKEHQLTGQKTGRGTYVVITQPGTGAKAQAGQTVSVHYRGCLLNGREFDASTRFGRPLDFVLGQNTVIAGWEEGIAQLTVGSKAILLIPSGLGYGPRGTGTNIPPNAVLHFEVELVAAK